MCGLEDYADASVGSLSVEYRKRTTIAVELAAKVRNRFILRVYGHGADDRSSFTSAQVATVPRRADVRS